MNDIFLFPFSPLLDVPLVRWLFLRLLLYHLEMNYLGTETGRIESARYAPVMYL